MTELDEDEFGDFGGFEEAEPPPSEEGPRQQTTPSAWASILTAPVSVPVPALAVDWPHNESETKTNQEKMQSTWSHNAPDTSTINHDLLNDLQKRIAINEEELIGKDQIIHEKEEKLAQATDKVQTMTSKLTNIEQEKLELEKDTEMLMLRNKELESEIEQLKENIDKRKELNDSLQKKHELDLEDIRKAGQTSVAVVIDEYKETFDRLLVEEISRIKDQVCRDIEEQEVYSKKLIQGCLVEERASLRSKSEEIIKEIKHEVKDYIGQLKQNGESERMKSLMSMDVFLESARQQLGHLMSSNSGTGVTNTEPSASDQNS